MSIERMTMVNIVGPIDILEDVCKQVVLSKCFHPVNAMDEIDTTDFTISTTENNLQALIDVNYVRPYVHEKDYSIISKKIEKLHSIANIEMENVNDKDLILDYIKLEQKVQDVSSLFEELNKELTMYKEKQKKLNEYMKSMEYFKEVNINMEDLEGVNNFYTQVYRISKDNIIKIKSNYDNIPSIVKSIYKDKEYNIVIVLTPKVLKKESDRIFKSLNCVELELPRQYLGTPSEILVKLHEELEKVNLDINNISNKIKKINIENKIDIGIVNRSFQLQKKTTELKDNTACTNEFFYLCGWVPESMLNNLKNKISCCGGKIILIEKKPDKIQNKNIIPPTKLKNNFFIKPFESMVNMYGIPSYEESDPTSFLAITYMIMFGAMFGDLGQGTIFIIAGLYLKYKMNRVNLGGILSRLGISSSIFGLIYGSIFGFDDLIEPLLIRPIDNIKEILLTAVIFGCLLLILGFIYSLINNIKKRDLENGLFGKDGLAGLIFYIFILIFAFTKVNNIKIFNTTVWFMLFIILLLIMVFKQPLANLIKNKRPLYNERKSDYFIEGGFGAVETILSMFSNTISFIRVGAFALNHVGLFVAFASMAQMMENGLGSIFIYILGNVVIIGLEGLIVFIQGLRLEYYELFSKYYDGSGLRFNPIMLSNE